MAKQHIAALRLLCPDTELTAAFYKAAFGAELPGPDTIRVGAQTIELAPTPMRRTQVAPGNATSFQHFAIIVSDIAAAYAHLKTVPGWSAISVNGPVRLPESSGGVTAFKFFDVDGHPLEFLEFPKGKAPDVWAKADGLFLGIDHSAITVSDTTQSIAFYEGLGFKVSHQTTNKGAEQAEMDAVDDPVVEVTGLTLGSGPPNLELLCYRQPGVKADARADEDILATEVILDGGAATIRKDPDGHRIAVP